MQDEEKIELCISCGKPTPYKKSDNIELRACYIEGAGQSCIDCFIPLYEKPRVEDLIFQ